MPIRRADGKELASWTLPGAGEPFGSLGVLWVAWLDSERVLTQLGGKVALWKVPECQALWTLDACVGVPALSPTRRYLVVCRKQGLQVLDAGTAELRGQLDSPPEGPVTMLCGAAFSPDGNELIASCIAGGTGKLIRWNLHARRKRCVSEKGRRRRVRSLRA